MPKIFDEQAIKTEDFDVYEDPIKLDPPIKEETPWDVLENTKKLNIEALSRAATKGEVVKALFESEEPTTIMEREGVIKGIEKILHLPILMVEDVPIKSKLHDATFYIVLSMQEYDNFKKFGKIFWRQDPDNEQFAGVDLLRSARAAILGLMFQSKKFYVNPVNAGRGDRWVLVCFSPRIRNGLETALQTGIASVINQGDMQGLRFKGTYTVDKFERASIVALEINFPFFDEIKNLTKLQADRFFGQFFESRLMGMTIEQFKQMTEFTTQQVLQSTQGAFLNHLELEKFVNIEGRIFTFIEGTGFLNPLERKNWPEAFKQTIDLLREDAGTSKKIEAIEYKQFGYSIWDASSTASSSDDQLSRRDFEHANLFKEIQDVVDTVAALDVP